MKVDANLAHRRRPRRLRTRASSRHSERRFRAKNPSSVFFLQSEGFFAPLRTALVLLFLAAAPALHGGTLDSSVFAMFPKNISEFGYADLSAARNFPWFPQFEAQVVPVSLYGFEQFLSAAQMQQAPSIDAVAWARIASFAGDSKRGAALATDPASGQIVGIAQGHFDLGAIKSFLATRQIPGVSIGDDVVYAAGTASGASDTYFLLASDQAIAFGTQEALKRLVDARSGAEENLLTNETMLALIDQVNGDGVFWGAFGPGGAQAAVQQLLPGVAKFPQGRDLLAKIKEVSISVKAPSDLELDFQAAAASPNDALLLSQLVQVCLLYQQQQTKQNDSGLGDILNGARVSANGNRLEGSLEVNDDQVLSLIEHDMFRLPM
jgi:hypothetical protein